MYTTTATKTKMNLLCLATTEIIIRKMCLTRITRKNMQIFVKFCSQ